ncbi:MAG: hypothetical protein JW810_14225 [Sedimentisphaerales bacterium]|nr:hypothetical protein [Sedimentisphaerales bacterium]
MKRIGLMLVLGCCLIGPDASRADVTLPAILGDHMVLQQGRQVPIWGWARPGEAIVVAGSWATGESRKTTADSEGAWMVRLATPKATDAGQELTIRGDNTITLHDVLIGEVWIGSGQSNMQWSVRASNQAEQEIAAADYPQIRLFSVPQRPAVKPDRDIQARWQVCSAETIPNFSAVAYFFGREIHRQVKVPVGLINTSWGGTRIEPWTPPEGFAGVEALQYVVKILEEATPQYRQALQRSIAQFDAWLADAKGALQSGADVPPPPDWPKHLLENHQQPTSLYNGMVYGLVPFGIRGAIWYQGESNRGEGMLYFEKMKALIQGWRTVWGQGEFPFYFVQLAPYRYTGNPQDTNGITMLPKIWEAQTATLALPHTGMAVVVDIANLNDIHPRNKQDVGKRLALWALARDYGQSDIVYSGPLYKSMQVEDGKIRIAFDHVGGGLISRDGKDLNWFEIAGADQQFVPARAMIDGQTVLVSSDQVESPVAVRFGWHELAEPNLNNKEGLPASPFRTDNW